MSKIVIEKLRHSYLTSPQTAQDYALQQIDLSWQHGGAYALLGPSGCGKTSLLNIISGLVVPTEGRIFFDERDVTDLPPEQRNIAQVFQFPIIYDTMTVRGNLTFPLRNRKIDSKQIAVRVQEIAAMLELEDKLDYKASGLPADDKQKISMGRGLMREDVNVIMFDEPLTVIDPLLKWQLRSKLKELHQKLEVTMVYVTHDQTEAMTFADQVVVMREGVVVQIGTPIELFDCPNHTFVGHFIGSPGMNVLACEISGSEVMFNGVKIAVANLPSRLDAGKTEIGIRPEYVNLASTGIEAKVRKAVDLGKQKLVETVVNQHLVRLLTEQEIPAVGETVYLRFAQEQTRLYLNDWLVS